MNKKEFALLLKAEDGLITPSDLKNKSNRTLLLGLSKCAPDYVTHHVYLFNGQIYVYQHSPLFNELCRNIHAFNNLDFLPNMNVNPALSDFEFLLLLKGKGIQMCFSPFIKCGKANYYGRLLPGHESCFESEDE